MENLMKKYLLRIGSYILVAALATFLTLYFYPGGGKLAELEALIDQCFVGDADPKTLEDAAAAAMVTATGNRCSQ